MKKITLLFILTCFTFSLNGQKVDSFISQDGSQIFFQEFGDTGETIVLLSGGPGLNPYYLEPLYNELKKKYRCILLHQRGTGKSILNEINEESINVQKYIDDLNGLYKKLGNEKLILVGHSWGGMLSFSYAANEPDKIKKVILLNTGGVSDEFYKWFGSNINMRLYPEDIKLRIEQNENNRETLIAIWPGYFFDREIALKTRPPLDYKFRNQKGVNPLASGDWRKRTNDRVSKLKNYTGPVDLITGRQDPVGESVVYEAKSILPQLKFTFIEKCGHFPWIEGEKQSAIFYKLFDESMKIE
tara:strand:- start:115 stop:1014 length:900 start_codon:yes stop_codon:yes gene_type:complete